MIRRLCAVTAAAVGLLVFAGAAEAATLGITAPPTSSVPGGCSNTVVIAQAVDNPSTPFILPAGLEAITQWQTYTAGDVPGSSITFAVLQPSATAGDYTVVGADSETLPNPLPATNVASFTLPTPIQAAPGETVALYSSNLSDVCYFDGGATPSSDVLVGELGSIPPIVGGQTVESGAVGGVLNLGFTVSSVQDANVTTSATGPVGVGALTVLGSVVTNGGPLLTPITFIDFVPSGLQIVAAVADNGTCQTSGQTVSCTISGLAYGQSVPVDVLVTAASPGSYTNTVNVATASGIPDPNASNNAASATLTVAAPPAVTPPQVQHCVVPGLRGTPFAVAKTVLADLGCTVTLVRKHSSVRKGLVVGTSSPAGSYPLNQAVTLFVSSGPKHRKHKKHH